MTATLGILAAVATACCAAALVALHLLPSRYDPVRNAVSDYGVGRYHYLYRVQATALGIAAILLAFAFISTVHPRPDGEIALLVAFGAARIAIPWFPTDFNRTRPTRTGMIHLLLAGIAFVTIGFAAADLRVEVRNDPGWQTVYNLVRGVGWVVVVTAILTALAVRGRLFRGMFGLVERSLYAAMLCWFLVVSLHVAA